MSKDCKAKLNIVLIVIKFRWKPFDLPKQDSSVDFIEVYMYMYKINTIVASSTKLSRIFFIKGLKTLCGAGDSKVRSGAVIYIYTCNNSMKDRYDSFYEILSIVGNFKMFELLIIFLGVCTIQMVIFSLVRHQMCAFLSSSINMKG